jgi:hypothetical protein
VVPKVAVRIIRRFENYAKLGAINAVHMLVTQEKEIVLLASTSEKGLRRRDQFCEKQWIRATCCTAANKKWPRFTKRLIPTTYMEAYLNEAFQLYVEWDAVAKLNQLAELHPYLRTKSRASTGGFSSASSGFMKARKRYNEETAGQYKQINCW